MVTCSRDATKTVVFKYLTDNEEQPPKSDNIEYLWIEEGKKIWSYQSVHISLDVDDSFMSDNSFEIFGGQKEVLKIQYTSSAANSFFNAAFFVLQNNLKDRWDIQITEIKDGNYATSDFDLYLFEHQMPESMPTDGVVFLVNPETVPPAGAGFRVSNIIDLQGRPMSLTAGASHPIAANIRADKINVSKYCRISQYDSSYEVLMTVDGNPALMVENRGNSKIVVMSFSVHFPIT